MSDMKTRASVFLEFMEDTIKEALDDPSSMSACLIESDGALRCLEKTLKTHDELDLAYTQFIVSPLNRFRFAYLQENTADEKIRLWNIALDSIEALKIFLI